MSTDAESLRYCLDPRNARPGNAVELLRDGAEAFPRMLQAIAAARHSILVEMYMIRDDATGRRFADALRERARAGVAVRILYDAVGSMETPRAFFDGLDAAGARTLDFTPLRPWSRRFGLRKRDHRKLLVADGQVAFVGGINLASDYDSPANGGLGWRDTAVRIEGPAAGDLARLFLATWRRECGGPALPEPPPVTDPMSDGISVAALGADRWLSRRSIGRAYLRALRAARRRIWIANAYFVPAGRFLRALRGAARRGVDVRVLVPAASDNPWVDHASRAIFDTLLRRGVRVFEWQGPMLHAKTAVIDGAWCTVGSFNLDHWSLFHNLELNIMAHDPGLGVRMEAVYEEDLRNAREVRREEWRRRGWRRRMKEEMIHLIRAFL